MIMKKLSFILSMALLVCFLAASAAGAHESNMHSRDYAEAIKTAREMMWKTICGGFCSGATVAIADEGHIVYAEGMGAADRAENRPVDVNTRFNVGSTSKMLAAVGILLLVDDGKVSLDDSVTKYIPEFRMKDPRYKDITVRMLFNHSSGLPGTHFYFGYKTDDYTHRLLIDSMAEAYLKHAPGAMAIYCNDGFTLAEMVVERVSGEKFADFIARRVFKPLGMKNSGPSIGESNAKNTAKYYGLKNAKLYPREVVMQYGAGGFSSTASDMCRFAASFSPYGKHILSEASIAEILRTQPTELTGRLRGPLFCSEFGWDYSSLPDYDAMGIQVLAKSGGTTCYNTYIQTVPKYGVTVVYSISGRIPNLEVVSRPILDAVMRCKHIDIPAPEPVKKPVEPQAIPEEMFACEGIYANGSDVIKVRFDMKNKKMDFIALPAEKNNGSKEPTGEALKEAAPVMSFVYNDGYFSCFEKHTTVYFTAIDGENYIAFHKFPDYGVDGLLYQRIKEISDPKKLRIDTGCKKWLVRNVVPYVVTAAPNISRLQTYAELPGYVNFDGLKKIETPECASIALTAFRDQAALSLVDVNGETWIKSNIFFYSPEDKLRKLVDGVNRVSIKMEQWSEWLKAEKGAIVKFDNPPAGSRIMVYAESGLIFDSVVDKDEFYAPAGSLIMFSGAPGDMFKVHAN